jgi:hypothetical protein
MRTLFALLLLIVFAAPAAAEEPRIDADKLPIDIARITKELKSITFREERDGLRLRYYLNINAPAPPLNIVINPDGTDSWLVGPVPHTAPTHKEFMDFVTPQEWRPAVPDVGALVKWLADKANKK